MLRIVSYKPRKLILPRFHVDHTRVLEKVTPYSGEEMSIIERPH